MGGAFVMPEPIASNQPMARLHGQPIAQLPLDLYIPPDALAIVLEQFEGPLDLLLYLIRKQNLDILDVHVALIVDQYMQYIDMMHAMQLELAGEYLVMAAMLAEIKSRMLLPKPMHDVDEDEDPRAELIRRLQQYEQFKDAAEGLNALPRLERDTFLVKIASVECALSNQPPGVDLKELMLAFASVLQRTERYEHHEIQTEQLSTREKMSAILARLQGGHFVLFTTLFEGEGRLGLVVSFLAILELVKESLVDVVQQEALSPLYLKLRDGNDDQIRYRTNEAEAF